MMDIYLLIVSRENIKFGKCAEGKYKIWEIWEFGKFSHNSDKFGYNDIQ